MNMKKRTSFQHNSASMLSSVLDPRHQNTADSSQRNCRCVDSAMTEEGEVGGGGERRKGSQG